MKAWDEALKRANIVNLRFHDLRHTFATYASQAGASPVAYMLANGAGKVRSDKNGCARKRLSWRLLFLSTGEISLAAHIEQSGKRARAGQEARILDIPADTIYGITGWSIGEADRGVMRCFHSWMDARGGTDPQEESEILAQVRRFFEQHGESRFTPWHADHATMKTRSL